MACPGCLIALAGFDGDSASADKPFPWMLVLAPVVGAIAMAGLGALVWKDKRALGGIVGFAAGGALGGVIAALLAKQQGEKSQAAALNQAAAQQAAKSGGGLLIDPSLVPGGSQQGGQNIASPKVNLPDTPSSDRVTVVVPELRFGAKEQAPSVQTPSEGSRTIQAGQTMADVAAQTGAKVPPAGPGADQACPMGAVLSGGRCVAVATPMPDAAAQYQDARMIESISVQTKADPSAPVQTIVAMPAQQDVSTVQSVSDIIPTVSYTAATQTTQQAAAPAASSNVASIVSAPITGTRAGVQSVSTQMAVLR